MKIAIIDQWVFAHLHAHPLPRPLTVILFSLLIHSDVFCCVLLCFHFLFLPGVLGRPF